jgi:hypothetical protein
MATDILKCTFKKSWDVFKKWIWGLPGCALAYGLYIVATCEDAGEARDSFYQWCCGAGNIISEVFGVCLSVARMVQWFVWVVAAIVIAIVAYSYAWCIAREITPMDWESSWRNEFGRMMISMGVIPIFGFVVCTVYYAPACIWVVIGLLGLEMLPLFYSMVYMDDKWMQPMLFLGAYRSMRRRVAYEKSQQGL